MTNKNCGVPECNSAFAIHATIAELLIPEMRIACSEANMYCTKCGVVLEGSAFYCSQCGTPTARLTAMSASDSVPRLTRSIYEKKIGGVCGGLARYLAADPTFVRLVWLVATICFPPLLLGYIGAWIILPAEAPRLLAPPLESSIPPSEPQATTS